MAPWRQIFQWAGPDSRAKANSGICLCAKLSLILGSRRKREITRKVFRGLLCGLKSIRECVMDVDRLDTTLGAVVELKCGYDLPKSKREAGDVPNRFPDAEGQNVSDLKP
jgi:hypothetical protein